jgi:hypothetical protein
MGCRGCQQVRGLAGAYGPEGEAWIDCLVQRLGFSAGTKWNAAVHAKAYELGSANIDLRGSRTEEQMRAEAFGSNPQRAAEVAASLPLAVWNTDDDQFWSCLGVTRMAAIAAYNAKSGRYYNMLIAAGSKIVLAEGGRPRPQRRGSIVAAGLTLAVGSGLLEWWGGRR